MVVIHYGGRERGNFEVLLRQFGLNRQFQVRGVRTLRSLSFPVNSDTLLVYGGGVGRAFEGVPRNTDDLRVRLTRVDVLNGLVRRKRRPFIMLRRGVLLRSGRITRDYDVTVRRHVDVHFMVEVAYTRGIMRIARVLRTGVPVHVPVLLRVHGPAGAANIVGQHNSGIPSVCHFKSVTVISTVLFGNLAISVKVSSFTVIIFLVQNVNRVRMTSMITRAMMINVLIFPDPMLHNRFTMAKVFVKGVLALVIVRHTIRPPYNVNRSGLCERSTISFERGDELIYQRRSFSVQVLVFSYRDRIECSTLLGRASFPR